MEIKHAKVIKDKEGKFYLEMLVKHDKIPVKR